MRKSILSHILTITLTSPFALPTMASSELSNLIDWAIEHDVGKQQLQYQADAITDMGIASSQLNDPKLKFGIAGLPVDSLAFDEDPMTNISVGLMQQFSRGDTLKLQQKQSTQQAESLRKKMGVRELDVTKAITALWIELAYQQHARQLLQQNLKLFRELENYLGTNYGLGVNQAQDLIQAQLQISRMDEKLQANEQMQQRINAQLSEWLGSRSMAQSAASYPQWNSLAAYLSTTKSDYYQTLASHPSVNMVNELIRSAETGIDIANESYKPQLGIEVMYAYRQADRMDGSPAPDLMSAFLTMDLPLFTEKRQDKKLSSAQHQLGVAKTQRDLMLQQMNTQISALIVDRNNISQRIERYQNALLQQAKEKTRAIERGYQNNTSQLDEYIRAASEELTIELEQARLSADLQQANNNLAYLLNKY